jgi:hypothetical protein
LRSSTDALVVGDRAQRLHHAPLDRPARRASGRERARIGLPTTQLELEFGAARPQTTSVLAKSRIAISSSSSARWRGIRAAVAVDPFSIERSILSNNCQILCLGERVVAPELASRIVSQWLGYEFGPSSPSAAKVKVITDYEEHGSL